MQTLDVAALTGWARRGLSSLTAAAPRLNSLNVFPVPDSDTGNNLLATWRAVHDAVLEAAGATGDPGGGSQQPPPTAAAVVAAAARGALMGARGNSGVILAQFLGGFGGSLRQLEGDAFDAVEVGSALRAGAEEARAAVAAPAEGTILTVLAAAADAAVGDDLAEVAAAVAAAAASAVEATQQQHPVLRQAGVVDAGGLGLQLLLEALADELAGRPAVASAAADTDSPRQADPPPPTFSGDRPDIGGPRYEVTYLLDADDAGVRVLRGQLLPLGDSLVIAGGRGLWSVHVHVDDVAAAIERGIEAGRLHRLGVTRFEDEHRPAGRAVLAVADGPGATALLEQAGARVAGGEALDAEALAGAVEACGAHEVVLLANRADRAELVTRVAAATRAPGRTVAVVPTTSPLQGLVAMSVGDPTRRFPDEVIAMAQAAAACRCVHIDAEGIGFTARATADGLIVAEGSELTEVALAAAAALAAGGGELLTVLVGRDAPEELGGALAQAHPQLTVDVRSVAPDTPAVSLGIE